MPSQSPDLIALLPRIGQRIEIEPAIQGSGYASTVLHVSDTRHVLVDLPPLGIPVSLRTPRNSHVVVRFRGRNGCEVTWFGVVRTFGNWGVGLVLEQPLQAGDASLNGHSRPLGNL